MSTVIKVNKFLNNFFKSSLKDSDKELYESVKNEFTRQQNHIELIASENILKPLSINLFDKIFALLITFLE